MTLSNPSATRGAPWPVTSATWYDDNLLDAPQVAFEVLAGIAEGRLYIFPHRLGRDQHARLMEGFDQAKGRSPSVAVR